MTFRRKHARWGIVLLLILLISVEISLRFIWGFGDAVLFRDDKDYEYIAIPQNRVRFGNHIYYNKYSQRNEELSDADSIRILIFGDSVINGGTQTDQDSLATTKLSQFLTVKYKKPVKVLNISAGSWGPDNCFGYLKQKGDFHAKKIVLVVSSHDAYDDMDFQPVVGVTENYPSKQYKIASLELLNRYIIPRLVNVTKENGPEYAINKKKDKSQFNSGFSNFYNYCTQNKIPFVIYLHADADEWKTGRYNSQGDEIINFCRERNISLIKELDSHFLKSIYRDDIHLNDYGQEKLFELIRDSI